jgi:hypothetical protein
MIMYDCCFIVLHLDPSMLLRNLVSKLILNITQSKFKNWRNNVGPALQELEVAAVLLVVYK